MPTFLLKTEPTQYSFADLMKEKRTTWTGVKNPAALIAIRTMKKGDAVFIYHTGDETAIVGLAKVVRGPYEDPAQPGRNDRSEPKFAVVDIEAVKPAKRPVTISEIKADARFAEFGLVKLSRLSAMPVPDELEKMLRQLAGV
jgi:predicted RNA-binding protein with PUA-like domain